MGLFAVVEFVGSDVGQNGGINFAVDDLLESLIGVALLGGRGQQSAQVVDCACSVGHLHLLDCADQNVEHSLIFLEVVGFLDICDVHPEY